METTPSSFIQNIQVILSEVKHGPIVRNEVEGSRQSSPRRSVSRVFNGLLGG